MDLERQPDLTIAIPTFNRASALDGTFRHILQAVEQAPGARVQVLVCDNNSTDDTRALVNDLKENAGDRVSVGYHLETKKGFDNNWLAAIQRSAGTFVWTLGDDDNIHPDAIGTLMPHFEEARVSFINVNARRLNDADTRIVDERMVADVPDGTYHDPSAFFFRPTKDSYFRFLGTYATTISTDLWNTNLANEHAKVVASDQVAMRSFIVQDHVLAEMAAAEANNAPIVWISEPLVDYRVFMGKPISQLAKNVGWRFNGYLLDRMEVLGYNVEGIKHMREVQRANQDHLFDVGQEFTDRYPVSEETNWFDLARQWYSQTFLLS